MRDVETHRQPSPDEVRCLDGSRRAALNGLYSGGMCIVALAWVICDGNLFFAALAAAFSFLTVDSIRDAFKWLEVSGLFAALYAAFPEIRDESEDWNVF